MKSAQTPSGAVTSVNDPQQRTRAASARAHRPSTLAVPAALARLVAYATMALARATVAVALTLTATAALALAAGLAWPTVALAQAPRTPVDPGKALDAARTRLESIQRQLRNPSQDLDLTRLRTDALDIQAEADRVSTAQAPELASVQARLTELGPAPAEGATPEAPDIAQQRATLNQSHDKLDAQVKLARLLSVEGGQVADRVTALRRSRFQASLGERTDSILAASFWSDLRYNLRHDTGGIQQLGADLASAAKRSPIWIWIGIAALALLTIYLRRQVDLGVRTLIGKRVPHGRLRRSLYAVFVASSWVLVPGVIGWLILGGFTWNGQLDGPTSDLLNEALGLMFFGGFVSGSGRALLSARRPTWRVAPISDLVATNLRWYPRAMAVVLVAIPLVEALVVAINASLETAVAIHCIFAVLLSIIIGTAMFKGERWRREAATDRQKVASGNVSDEIGVEGSGPRAGAGAGSASATAGAAATASSAQGAAAPPRPLWLLALAALGWAVLVGGAVCLLIGYVALGSFVVRQLAWVQIVAGTAYLLVAFIDDALMTWVGRREPTDEEALVAEQAGARADITSDPSPTTAAAVAAALPRTPLEQVAVLASALLRLVVYSVAVVLIAAPFGAGPSELLARTDQLREGLLLGELRLSPIAVMQACVVLGLGLLAVRLVQRWLLQRFLPTTNVEPGMYSSVTTLLGYVGGVLALAAALATLGLSLERIAWLASALSVGIGFGLQAVVSNFISGLILLAERPVRVGDWVSLGGSEGDIKRINVRATEIQLGDRSTVIVPNSEFITKTVRNVTRANPMGLVQMKLPMPLDTDANEVRTLLLAAFEANPSVLATPPPNVFLEGVEGQHLVFNANASVASPRMAYGVRSELLFDILQRLRDRQIALGSATRLVLRDNTDSGSRLGSATETSPAMPEPPAPTPAAT